MRRNDTLFPFDTLTGMSLDVRGPSDADGTLRAPERDMKWHASAVAGARIIVAEDDDAMRSIVVEALCQDGYRVWSVADGGELLAELGDDAGSRFDLIISDIRMPIRDGLTIVDQLRKNHCTTPVILMTAFGDDRARETAQLLNATLLDKPFELYDLRTAVLNIL